MSNYSKHKDRLPQDTIAEIQRILHESGIITTLDWIPSPYSGVCSNRITLYPTDLGANGKGTDRLYAMASGYAELMERIQNYMLPIDTKYPGIAETEDFLFQPDERQMPVEELIAQKDPFLAFLSGQMGFSTDEELVRFLQDAAKIFENRTDGSITVIPFVDLFGERVVWLPVMLLRTIYTSNGMAAGNTMPEALVQSISELFERFVNTKMLLGEAVPPEIPDEALRQFSFWNVIEQIRAGKRFAVTVMDCSLGKGLPVAGVRITDLEKGRFSLKLGSHPSFAVAVERALTESFQGWESQDDAASLCMIDTPEKSMAFHNIPNIKKTGIGCYPAKLLTDEPDWSFHPWMEWEGMDNQGFLKKMLEILKKDGVPVLVRDVSHMGFPSCHVILPGRSELYPVSRVMLRLYNTIYRNEVRFRRFPDYSPEEERKFLYLIRFQENSLMDNKISSITLKPISGEMMSIDRIGAFLALKAGEFGEARRLFLKMLAREEDTGKRTYLICLAEYARYRAIGLGEEQVAALIRSLFQPEIAARVEEETRDPETMLQKVFPHVHCFDCGKCALAGKECMQPQVQEIRHKITTAMASSHVSQTKMLSSLKKLLEN